MNSLLVRRMSQQASAVLGQRSRLPAAVGTAPAPSFNYLTRLFSTAPSEDELAAVPDLSHLVQGYTKERFLADPEYAEFMRANFPEKFEQEEEELSEQDRVGLAILNNPRAYINEPKEKPKKPKKSAEEKEAMNNPPLNMRPMHTVLRDPVNEVKQHRSKNLRNVPYGDKWIPGALLLGGQHLDLPQLYPWQRVAGRNHQLLVKTPWVLLQAEVEKYLANMDSSRVYNLSVYETKEAYEAAEPMTNMQVVPKNINWHYSSSIDMYCINYVKYRPGKSVIQLPIKYANQEESPALKRGSFVVEIQRKVPVLIEEGMSIPDFIEVECTGLMNKDVIRRDRLIIPEGITLAKKVLKKPHVDYVIGSVVGSNRGLNLEQEAGEEAAAA